MRIAYLDCFAGIAGDMFLAALLDAGVPRQVLDEATAALNLGASLRVETVDRSGISSTRVTVLEHGAPAEPEVPLSHSHVDPQHESTHTHEHTHDGVTHTHEHTHGVHTHDGHTHDGHTHNGHTQDGHTHTQEHTHDGHTHTHSHTHSHDHPHTHGRSLTVIRDLIQAAALAPEIKTLALRAFELLGASEAKIHNVPVDRIHFHEVGAVDAIVDIVAASAGIVHLRVDRWFASPLNVGGGMVECAHGLFPIPAPAVADLLRGVPTYSAHIQKELVTPTGAALIRALDPVFGAQPAMRADRIGYGAGSRNPKDFPNVLRLTVGDTHDSIAVASSSASSPSAPITPRTVLSRPAAASQQVTVLETALDDLSPQILAHVAEQALALGALDVMSTAVVMKKGRAGTLLTILTDDTRRGALEQLLLRETTTLGIRISQQQRITLDRTHHTVKTAFGTIRVKQGSRDGEELNAHPEFEDCRIAALLYRVPLKQVAQAALTAYAGRLATAKEPTSRS